VRGTELALKDSLCELEIGKSLLISLKHIHAATKVIINSSGVHSVSTETLLSNLSGLEVTSKCPCWLIGGIEDLTETAIWECLIWVIVNEVDLFSSNVA
jgi:hypothetical protein